MTGTHVEMPYPWVSYSDCRTFFSCKLKFKLSKLDGLKSDYEFDWLRRGSDIHLIFNAFFEEVNLDNVVELASRIRVLDTPNDTLLYAYFIETCLQLAGKGYLLETEKKPHMYTLNIQGFCHFQVECIISIMATMRRISKAMLSKYWVPKGREIFLKDFENKLYGTIDTWYEDFDGGNFILDYKTGKKHPSITRSGSKKKPALHFPQNMQVWFYTRLLSLHLGIPWNGMKGIVLWTKEYPVPVTLKIIKGSQEGLFKRVKEIRDHVDQKKPWNRCYEEDETSMWFVCPYCDHQARCHLPTVLEKFAEIRQDDGN